MKISNPIQLAQAIESAPDKPITDPEYLSTVSTELYVYPEELLAKLVNKLITANNNAWVKGCGLAAIQIGVPVRVAFYVFEGKAVLLINPHILKTYGKVTTRKEGCLSIPDKWLFVPRHQKILIENNGFKRAVKREEARIIQHEIDHMNGLTIRRFSKDDN